jgi:hypothetical protein
LDILAFLLWQALSFCFSVGNSRGMKGEGPLREKHPNIFQTIKLCDETATGSDNQSKLAM